IRFLVSMFPSDAAHPTNLSDLNNAICSWGSSPTNLVNFLAVMPRLAASFCTYARLGSSDFTIANGILLAPCFTRLMCEISAFLISWPCTVTVRLPFTMFLPLRDSIGLLLDLVAVLDGPPNETGSRRAPGLADLDRRRGIAGLPPVLDGPQRDTEQ